MACASARFSPWLGHALQITIRLPPASGGPFLLITSPSSSFKLGRFRCGSFPVVPSLFFFVAALSASFHKSFLLIASPSFSLELVRFRCGSFPVVPSVG